MQGLFDIVLLLPIILSPILIAMGNSENISFLITSVIALLVWRITFLPFAALAVFLLYPLFKFFCQITPCRSKQYIVVAFDKNNNSALISDGKTMQTLNNCDSLCLTVGEIIRIYDIF